MSCININRPANMITENKFVTKILLLNYHVLKIVGLSPLFLKNNRVIKNKRDIYYSYFILVVVLSISLWILINKEKIHPSTGEITGYTCLLFGVFTMYFTILNSVLQRDKVKIADN